jgi:hypothetical protein
MQHLEKFKKIDKTNDDRLLSKKKMKYGNVNEPQISNSEFQKKGNSSSSEQ